MGRNHTVGKHWFVVLRHLNLGFVVAITYNYFPILLAQVLHNHGVLKGLSLPSQHLQQNWLNLRVTDSWEGSICGWLRLSSLGGFGC